MVVAVGAAVYDVVFVVVVIAVVDVIVALKVSGPLTLVALVVVVESVFLVDITLAKVLKECETMCMHQYGCQF